MKTLRTAPFALLALVLALVLVGSSCSSANPVALQVGEWQLSTKTFEDQMSSFFDAYSKAAGEAQAKQSLKGTTSGTWSTTFTSKFLNDQLNLQLAKLAVAERGLEVTQDDLDQARTTLEKNYADQSGQSVFGVLDQGYQQALVEGVAAQSVLQADLIKDKTTDEALRRIYDSDPSLYAQACVSHILVIAGQPDGKTAPSDAAYADALAKIQQIQSQLKGTSNFADLATANSADTGSAAKGGDLGCAAKGTYVTEFDDAVWSQPVGVVGPPVKSIYGYHLILVTSRTTPSFEDAKAQILQSVQSAASGLMSDELANVAKTTKITVDGRYGQFDASTAQITAPAGAQQPSTASTVDPLLGTGAQ